ncbi:hypothetical protein [Halocynthiibacter namhaensis]|nr:hypothetical protein [Halocynthiibacter namhaensis]
MFTRLGGFLERFDAPPEYRPYKRPEWGDVQRDWDGRMGAD